MFSEMAVEDVVKNIVAKIEKSLEKFKNSDNIQAIWALQEIGRFTLTQLKYTRPEWSQKYEKLFNEPIYPPGTTNVEPINLWQCPECNWLQGTRDKNKKMICGKCHKEMNPVPYKMWKFANGKEISLNVPTYKDGKGKDIWMCQHCCNTGDKKSWETYYKEPCCINCDDGTLIDRVEIMDKIILI